MFTGLVEEIGRVVRVTPQQTSVDLEIAAERVRVDLAVDDSVAVDGVCLTVVELTSEGFRSQAVAETLQRSTLGSFRPGQSVNLERALLPTTRFGGHFVQGHVDGVGEVVEMTRKGEGMTLAVDVPGELLAYIVPKGSIALDGVSLTVAAIDRESILAWLIPHTLANTTLGRKSVGELLNIEVDIVGKYIAHLSRRESRELALSEDLLKEWGY